MIYRKEKNNMKATLNPFENAKRTAQATGGVSPSIIEEMQSEISILGSQNETQSQDITDIKAQLEELAGPYSTTEHKTGRKWIDGKDIYEKVVTLATTLTVSRTGSDTGIAPFHETMISAKGNASNGSCICFMEFVQNSTINLACSNDFAVDNIIFEYTKPTGE